MSLFNIVVSYSGKVHQDLRYYQPIGCRATGEHNDIDLCRSLNSYFSDKHSEDLLPYGFEKKRKVILGLDVVSLYCDCAFLSIKKCLSQLEELDFIIVCDEVCDIRVHWLTLAEYIDKQERIINKTKE